MVATVSSVRLCVTKMMETKGGLSITVSSLVHLVPTHGHGDRHGFSVPEAVSFSMVIYYHFVVFINWTPMD